jgi:hypothetical protein
MYLATRNGSSVSVQLVASVPPPTQPNWVKPAKLITAKPSGRNLQKPPLPRRTAVPPASRPNPAQTGPVFVDNWEQILNAALPPTGCDTYYNNGDGTERFWGNSTYKYNSSPKAAWPAAAGANAVNPANNYPAKMYTGILCGPWDLSQAKNFLVRFALWRDLHDPEVSDTDLGDQLYFAVASNCNDQSTWSYLLKYDDVASFWGTESIWLTDWSGSGFTNVCIAWEFYSDEDANVSQGPWLDDLEVWRYNTPQYACNENNSGNRGVVLPSYEKVGSGWYPIIRSGGITALQALQQMGASNAKWVRLGFEHQNGLVDMLAYDRMVDSLCASVNGSISVLGLVNHQLFTRDDYNNPNTAADYRQAFNQTVSFLAKHFKGRIKYWEVWNEEDNAAGAGVDPVRYAPLLKEAATAIKQGNPNAKVLSGGLASAWTATAHTYFQNVYVQLNGLGGARPFDVFADHPYTDGEGPNLHGKEPWRYLHAPDELAGSGPTIVQKFITTMNTNQDNGKKLWITEIGWNSNAGATVACQGHIAVNTSQQATYLGFGFDILFSEVLVNSVPGVEKIFWCQYRDTGDKIKCNNVEQPIDWWYGLYNGASPPERKPAECVFRTYPDWRPCIWSVYLPLINK